MNGEDRVDRLLDEQLAYYRARAPVYDGVYERSSGPDPALASLVDHLRPTGSILELACGTGQWTTALCRHADRVLALDASSEMVEIARRRVPHERVWFVVADVFSWCPRRRFDVVFFGFWLSHVPAECFEAFWDVVDRCLVPDGRVLFVDTGPEEAAFEEFVADGVALRRLPDESEWHLVKVLHEPTELEGRLRGLGWEISIRPVGEHFYVGSGRRR